MLLVIGDLNARVGNDNTDRESNMGTHGCGIMNDNGQHLCKFCEENKLVIGGNIFHHKESHKKTWTSPVGATTSQIDHVLVNKKWRSLLQDVRTRGDLVSDHNLVTRTVTLKLRKTKRGEERARQLDSKRLKNDEAKTAFRLELRNRFSVLEEEQEINIAIFNQAIREAGVKVLGYKTKKRKEWMK